MYFSICNVNWMNIIPLNWFSNLVCPSINYHWKLTKNVPLPHPTHTKCWAILNTHKNQLNYVCFFYLLLNLWTWKIHRRNNKYKPLYMKLKENWFIPSISRKQTATSHLKQNTTTYGVRNPFPALVQERNNAMLSLLMGSQPSASNYRISYDNTYINNLKKKHFKIIGWDLLVICGSS